MSKILDIIETNEEIDKVKYDTLNIITEDEQIITIGIEEGCFCCEQVNIFVADDIKNIYSNLNKLKEKYINKTIKSIEWDHKSIKTLENKVEDNERSTNAIVLCIDLMKGNRFMIGCSNNHNGYYGHKAFAKYNGKTIFAEL